MEEELKKRENGGLKRQFLNITLLPLIFIGIIIISMISFICSNSLYEEVSEGLYNLANTVLASYDALYPGDFNLMINEESGESFLKKGDVMLSGDTSLIDHIKEKTGVEVSVFFYDQRNLTTITQDGKRVKDTICHQQVIESVLIQKSPAFFKKVKIGSDWYFAQYVPVFGSDGTCVGMIGTAKPAQTVAGYITKILIISALLIIFTLTIVGFIMAGISASIVDSLNGTMKFLGEIADGDLSTTLDEMVLKREDEIGRMGRFTLRLQTSLKKLIERDALTGIYNRRYAISRLEALRDNSSQYCVAMCDIDFFKKVNDTYGHDAGDEILKNTAKVLSDTMVTRGFAARWGGEEFLLVFESYFIDAAAELLEEMLSTLRNLTISCGDYDINITMSIGMATADTEESIDFQIKKADEALYYSKESGRDRLTLYDNLISQEG